MSYSPTPKFSERFIKTLPVQAVVETVAPVQAPAEPYSFFGERFFGGRTKPFREAASPEVNGVQPLPEEVVTYAIPANMAASATSKLKDAGILTFPVPDAAKPDAKPNLHLVVVDVMDKEKAKAVLDVMDPSWSDTAVSAKT